MIRNKCCVHVASTAADKHPLLVSRQLQKISNIVVWPLPKIIYKLEIIF